MKISFLHLIFTAFSIQIALAQENHISSNIDTTTWEFYTMNKPAPKILVTTIDGRSYQLGKSGDEIMVVNFWFIACGPCRKELPLLNDLAAKYSKNHKIRFVAISNLDTKKGLEFVRKKLNMGYELVAQAQETANAYHIQQYPSNLIIDKNGIVVFAEIGFHDDINKRMEKVIDRLIE
jgi:thiol-disulfide isomerase/thioredoxin